MSQAPAARWAGRGGGSFLRRGGCLIVRETNVAKTRQAPDFRRQSSSLPFENGCRGAAAVISPPVRQGGVMAGKTILETERLLLREFDEDDAPAFYLLGSDPA